MPAWIGLKSIAISRGVLDADSAARMSDNDAYNLIFAPGFSPSGISDISVGRGEDQHRQPQWLGASVPPGAGHPAGNQVPPDPGHPT